MPPQLKHSVCVRLVIGPFHSTYPPHFSQVIFVIRLRYPIVGKTIQPNQSLQRIARFGILFAARRMREFWVYVKV